MQNKFTVPEMLFLNL